MKFSYIVYLTFLSLLLLAGCKLSDRDLLAPPTEVKKQIPVEVAKWFNNYQGAVSLNYDYSAPHNEHSGLIQNLVLQSGLKMDFELVTYEVMKDSLLIRYIQDIMIPNDFGFFGHGHKHINHDALSYDECLVSFKQCYEDMLRLGIKPVAYAYPGGWGYQLSTRKALKDAGFLCGRKFEQLDISDPYILSDSVTEPKDWFALPSLVMQSIEYDGCVICVNNSEELSGFIKEAVKRKAWVILTYHDIGLESEYGFYELDDFKDDLKLIKSQDIWCAKISDIVLYIYERKNVSAFAELISDGSDIPLEIRISLRDDLRNDYYNQPLTLLFDIPQNWLNKDLVLTGTNTSRVIRTNMQPLHISIPPDESLYTLKLR